MNRADKHRRAQFTRRGLFLGGGTAGLVGLLAGKLHQLQILENGKYSTLSDRNRITHSLLPPIRGKILDRNGVPLAENLWFYRVSFFQSPQTDSDTALQLLDELLGLGEERLEKVKAELRAQGMHSPVLVASMISWEDLTRVAAHSSFLQGTEIERFSLRHYPGGEAGAHLVGYVSQATKEDYRTDAILSQVPDYQIGRSGIEHDHERDLRGGFGSKQTETDAHRQVVRTLEHREGSTGNDLWLTVDRNLQELAQKHLAGKTGAVTLLDVHSGEVLACCSSPSFDPNAFAEGMGLREWEDLRNDPEGRLLNKAANGVYPPGSVFKLVVALAALAKGLDPQEQAYCNGSMPFGDRIFHCWRKGGHGTVDLGTAISRSCDVYFYRLALKVGVDEISKMARRFGFGSPTAGGRFPAESAGLVPTKSWKRRRFDEPWQKGETLNLGIGQGFLLATPLQLAAMTCQIANGGKKIEVRFTRDGQTPNPLRAPSPKELPLAVSSSMGLSRESFDMVRAAMEDVVNNPRGTAYASRIKESGFEMAGKTGTSQVRRISLAERRVRVLKNEELPRKWRDHAIFVGYAPIVNPRYAVSVVVEHGGSGSKAAAPIAKDMLFTAQTQISPVASRDREPT